jgi:hypothetical protein
MAASDGFRSYIPKRMDDNKNSYNIRYFSSNINDDPNNTSSPNFRGTSNNLEQTDGFIRNRTQFSGSLGPRDEEPNIDLGYLNNIDNNNQNYLSSYQCLDGQKMNIFNNLYGISHFNSNNLASFALSYDKDFNISESKIKKNGLKYSLDGKQLNEYLKSTKKRRKKSKKTHNDH